MNSVEKNGKGKNTIIVILILLLLVAIIFICYDKMLNKQKTTKKDCKCPICEKCILENKEENNSKDKICELDMANKTNLEVYDLCEKKGFVNASRIKINNIQINDKFYQLYYIHEKYCDPVEGCNNFKASVNSVTKVFIDDILLDVYKGKNRQLLWAIRIDNNNLVLSETWPSEVPPVDYTYDLKNLK